MARKIDPEAMGATMRREGYGYRAKLTIWIGNGSGVGKEYDAYAGDPAFALAMLAADIGSGIGRTVSRKL